MNFIRKIFALRVILGENRERSERIFALGTGPRARLSNSFPAKIGKIEEGQISKISTGRWKIGGSRVYFERRTSPDFFSISVNPRYPRGGSKEHTSQSNLDRSSGSLFHSLVQFVDASQGEVDVFANSSWKLRLLLIYIGLATK